MKILHALVGYLAVTALHLHLFAFASPLEAIYYDGYVDTSTTQNYIDGALMKHVLGSILETCQTVTTVTQNHSDSAAISAFMKRVPGDIVEARQVPTVPVPVITVIYVIVSAMVISFIWISYDDPVRGNLNDVEFLVEHFD